jgi:hypothetical protein
MAHPKSPRDGEHSVILLLQTIQMMNTRAMMMPI